MADDNNAPSKNMRLSVVVFTSRVPVEATLPGLLVYTFYLAHSEMEVRGKVHAIGGGMRTVT